MQPAADGKAGVTPEEGDLDSNPSAVHPQTSCLRNLSEPSSLIYSRAVAPPQSVCNVLTRTLSLAPGLAHSKCSIIAHQHLVLPASGESEAVVPVSAQLSRTTHAALSRPSSLPGPLSPQ